MDRNYYFFFFCFLTDLISKRICNTYRKSTMLPYYYFIPWEFFKPVFTGGFSLKSEWQQVYSDLQKSSNYSTDFNRAVVWMVSIFPLISNSPILFSRPLSKFQGHLLQLVASSPSCFTCFSALWQHTSICLSFLLSFIFILWFTETPKSTWCQILFFFINTRCHLLLGMRWPFCISKSQRILFVSFFDQ